MFLPDEDSSFLQWFSLIMSENINFLIFVHWKFYNGRPGPCKQLNNHGPRILPTTTKQRIPTYKPKTAQQALQSKSIWVRFPYSYSNFFLFHSVLIGCFFCWVRVQTHVQNLYEYMARIQWKSTPNLDQIYKNVIGSNQIMWFQPYSFYN